MINETKERDMEQQSEGEKGKDGRSPVSVIGLGAMGSARRHLHHHEAQRPGPDELQEKAAELMGDLLFRAQAEPENG